jgi:hypothetical protein
LFVSALKTLGNMHTLCLAAQVIVTLKHDWPVLDTSFSPVDDTMLVSGRVGSSND